MTIKVYESIMPGDPAEVYDDHGMTIESWIKGQSDDYQRGSVQPVSCMVNGAIVKPVDWCDVVIGQSDCVEFRPVPRGDVGNALAFVFPTVFGPVVGPGLAVNALIDIPGQPGPGDQGSRLNPADARANTVRLGEGVPEVFGRYIRYPDYLNAPRRFYLNERTQVLRLMLCVGVGSYEIDSDLVKIGETPIGEISGASFEVFEPGDSVFGSPNHQNWYNAPEVSSTQSSAGIALRGVTFDQRTYSGPATPISAPLLNAALTGIEVNERWGVGIRGSITMTQSVSVTGNAISGGFQHLALGMTVNVESDIGVSGTYVVSSYTSTEIELETVGGDPVTIPDNSGSMAIDKDGTEYVVTNILSDTAINVDRVLTGGATDPDWTDNLPAAGLTVEILWIADTFPGATVGPFVACPEGETTEIFEVDVFAPQGLGVVNGESVDERTREITIRWREVGATTWTEQTEQVTGGTRDQLGWTFFVSLPSAIRPEVEVARVGSEDVSVESLDKLEITALRSRLPTVTSYPGVTTMAVTIVGANEIGSQSNNRINLVPVRKLEPVGGGTEAATRSISRAAAYVAKSLGYDVDQLDIDEFERLETLWSGRGDTFDFVFNSGTAKDAMDTILRAGFAQMTLDNGVITPVRDEPRTQLEQGYGPENMTAPLVRSFTGKQPDEPDGVEVEYTRDGTWTEETVQCFLPGDLGIKVDKIKLDGVTDETRAWRIGMRRRRGQRYRRWEYSFETELDALNSQYLSYVPLVDQIPGYGQPSVLTGIDSDRITVSEPIEWEAGVNYVVAYRDENGDTQGPFPAAEGPDENTILVTIPEPWPAILPGDREPTHVYFGPVERWSFPSLITEIRPQGPLSASVSAVNYDERVYDDDDSSPS